MSAPSFGQRPTNSRPPTTAAPCARPQRPNAHTLCLALRRGWSSVERVVFRAVTLARQCRRPVFHLCHRPGFRRKLAPGTTGSRAQPLRRKQGVATALHISNPQGLKLRFCPNLKKIICPFVFPKLCKENLNHEMRRYIITPHTFSPLSLSLSRRTESGGIVLAATSHHTRYIYLCTYKEREERKCARRVLMCCWLELA